MDKTRGYQASIGYLMPIVTHPVMTGEYCRHLRNSIDAMIKFERIQSELERLNAENARLRKVADAARAFVGCPCEDDGTAECAECTACNYRQALAELDKESE